MEFVYLYVGMSGQKMVDALNGNFRGIKSKFVDTDAQLDLRIFSNDVKEVKNIDGILYYTEDDATVEDKNWKPHLEYDRDSTIIRFDETYSRFENLRANLIELLTPKKNMDISLKILMPLLEEAEVPILKKKE